MKKFIKLVLIVLFVILLVGPSIVWIFLSDNKEINFDLGENRNLAEFPEEFAGNHYPDEIENWYNDNLPFRSVLHTGYSMLDTFIDSLYIPEEEPDIDTVPHTHLYREALFLEPLCIESGKSQYLCECGDFFEIEHAALGHNYELSEDISPSCINDGTLVYKCSRCGNTYTETIPKLGHNYVITDGFELSCTESGFITYTCTVCKDSYQIESAGAGHKWEIVDSLSPTCTQDGFTSYECSACNEVRTDVLPSYGHSFVISEKIEEDCINDGYIVYQCSQCPESYREELIHHHNLEFLETVAPTYEDYGYKLNKCSNCGSFVRSDIREKLIKSTKKPLKYYNSIVIDGKCDWLFYAADNSEQYYKGTNLPSEKQLEKEARILSQLDELCKKLGKQLVIMIDPDKEKVFPEFYPSVSVVNKEGRVESLVKYIRQNTNVKIIYPLEELIAAKPYWQVYFRLDTHWNNAGAYIGTKALYDILDLPSIDLISLPVCPQETLSGDLVNLGNLANNKKYEKDVNYKIDYRPEITVSSYKNLDGNNEMLFASADQPVNKKNIFYVGDSYRIAMQQFLVKDFANSTIIHRDYINENNIRQSILNSDIIVIAAVERYEESIPSVAENIIKTLSILDK